MTAIVEIFLSILSSLTGQLGPNYDPLFYDVMIYIYISIIFAILIGFAVVIVVVKIIRKRSKSSKIPGRTSTDDTMFYGCPRCGRNTQIISGKQYCTVCKIFY